MIKTIFLTTLLVSSMAIRVPVDNVLESGGIGILATDMSLEPCNSIPCMIPHGTDLNSVFYFVSKGFYDLTNSVFDATAKQGDVLMDYFYNACPYMNIIGNDHDGNPCTFNSNGSYVFNFTGKVHPFFPAGEYQMRVRCLVNEKPIADFKYNFNVTD